MLMRSRDVGHYLRKRLAELETKERLRGSIVQCLIPLVQIKIQGFDLVWVRELTRLSAPHA